MNGTSRSSNFMKSPLVTWVKTFQEDEESSQKDIRDYKQLCDGTFLHNVWLQIDPQPPHQNTCSSIDETGSRIRNLSLLISNVKAFYENVLGQILVLRLPDIIKIASNPNDDSTNEDMRILLMLLLGSAVQCEQKEYFIDAIKQLDVSVQHAIVEYIQQITDNPASVWLNTEWGELGLLPEDEHERERMYSTLVQNVNRLAKERDELMQRTVDLVLELDSIRSNLSVHINTTSLTSSTSCNSTASPLYSNSSPIIMNSFGDQKSHLLVELADVKSKLRRVQQELEEKSEIVSELKETLEQSKETSHKLRQDNLELIQEARSAKAYRDEIDVLNERVRKVDRLENEVQRYRDRMNEMDFYKSRVEELREDNRILSETKLMLEEQLEGSRKRADQIPELEAQMMKLRAYTSELGMQRDLDRDQIESMVEEIAQLQFDKKAVVEELAQVQAELGNLRCQMKSDLLHQNGEGNLLEQINNDTSKRVLKLELENQRLQSFVENIRNHKTLTSSASFFNNNNNNNEHFQCSRMSIDSLPNGNDADEMLSPGDMSVTSDSPSVSLAAEINAKLERIENENACLRRTIDRLNEAEANINDLEFKKNELENELRDVKSKRESDLIKYEQLERSYSHVSTENQRLQRSLENNAKRLDETHHEVQALENENHKLLMTAETLKSTVKRLNDLEKEVTNLEAENHRLEQEKKSVEKEIIRLKQAIDSKDRTIDEYASKMSSIELENKRMRKDNESSTLTNARLKELEKENKDQTNELFVCKKTVTTLRQDLVNEKIKSHQMNCEFERINSALQKIEVQKCGILQTESLSNVSASVNTPKDWGKHLEDVFDNMFKKIFQMKEMKIVSLETSLREVLNKNIDLNNGIEALKSPIETATDGTQFKGNGNLVHELQRKVTLIEDENKNLENANGVQKDNIVALQSQITTLKSLFESVNGQCEELQQEQARLQVENSLLKSQSSSVNSQAADLQAQLVHLEEIKDKLNNKCDDLENSYKNLLADHEALQKLHEQLTGDYETQQSNCSTLKLAHKNLRAEHKSLQEKLQSWVVSQEELQKMKDAIDAGNNDGTTKDMAAENDKLKEEFKVVDEELKRLQTEYKMLQNIYKKLRSENNELKLKHTELQGETADCRDRMSLLDVEVTKLSNYCEVVALTNNSLESHRKNLISNVSNLLSQYHEMLSETANNSNKMVIEKIHDLCSKKEKLEKMIKDYDVTVEKKKVAVTAPNVVRRIHRSTTDLCLSKTTIERAKSERNSAPCDSIEEAIYGRIWEAATPSLSSNTAVLRPIRNTSSSSLTQEYNCDLPTIEEQKAKRNATTPEELIKPERNYVKSPPPRPPPRVSTTIENKMTISVITSPTHTSHANDVSSNGAVPLNSASHNVSLPNYGNFSRGSFKSNSINYGSPIRRHRNDHQPLRNGHHHFHHHHFHIHHPHSASPSLHSDSSLTPVEDSEFSDGAIANNDHHNDHQRVLNVFDNLTVNSNTTTNSIWYEYGCV